MRALSETAAAGWPLAALTLATAMVWRGWLEGRRRSALNRALHELRRPLQGLYLSLQPGTVRGTGGVPSTLALISAALSDLDSAINGAGGPRLLAARHSHSQVVAVPAPTGCCHALLRAAEARWRPRATVAGGSVHLRWRAGMNVGVRDPARVAQAVDNLVANAIEHGGAEVTIDASRCRDNIRIAICDRGAGVADPDAAGERPMALIARLTGRRRRGHGLAIVRDVAGAAGGRFFLRPSPWGSRAVLELPAQELGDALPA